MLRPHFVYCNFVYLSSFSLPFSSVPFCIAPFPCSLSCVLAMAVKLDHAHVARKAEEAEVSICVSGIIEAFTNGLDIFKKLRERRRKRRSKRDTEVPDSTSTAEHQLSKSLRRGPEEVAGKYTECYYSGIGPRFAKGDCK